MYACDPITLEAEAGGLSRGTGVTNDWGWVRRVKVECR